MQNALQHTCSVCTQTVAKLYVYGKGTKRPTSTPQTVLTSVHIDTRQIFTEQFTADDKGGWHHFSEIVLTASIWNFEYTKQKHLSGIFQRGTVLTNTQTHVCMNARTHTQTCMHAHTHSHANL
eukprot:TRINITY_DN32626_c0_g1_i6.p2 TRINITY_DN32626_c0_g1~~TRINITY_DN32626_c0_g1_i6.p2  ORF type:complete len:123 (-),score=13.72 TRINITY_DN32626_c0_g1_i6:642-1010(-)